MRWEEQSASDIKSGIAVFENDIRHCEEAIESAKRSMESSEETKAKLVREKAEAEEKLAELNRCREEIAAEISETEAQFELAESESAKLGNSVDKAGGEINSLYIRQSEYRFACESAKTR